VHAISDLLVKIFDTAVGFGDHDFLFNGGGLA